MLTFLYTIHLHISGYIHIKAPSLISFWDKQAFKKLTRQGKMILRKEVCI